MVRKYRRVENSEEKIREALEKIEEERKMNIRSHATKIAEEYSKVCMEEYDLSGLHLQRGDVIEIMMKGRTIKDIITAEYICMNPHYATMLINTEGYEVLIKLRDVKLIRKKMPE